MIKLKEILIGELERLHSRTDDEDPVDYEYEVNAINKKFGNSTERKDTYNGYEFLKVKDKLYDDDIYLMYRDNNIIGFAKVEPFEDSFKMRNIAIKPEFGGEGIGQTIYDYLISKIKLYSDLTQTPQSRKSWVKLSKKYKIKGYNLGSNKIFDVRPTKDGTELESVDPKYILYKDWEKKTSITPEEKNQENYLVVEK